MSKSFSYIALGAALLFLAFLLLPNYGNPKVNSLKTHCLSNMKQLGTAIAVYSTDFDDTLPYASTAAGPSGVGWAARIRRDLSKDRYSAERNVFRDPADKGAPLSYAMNANVASLPKLAAHTNPERSVLLFEISGARAGRDGTLESALRQAPVGDGAVGGFLDSTDLGIEPSVRSATGPFTNSGLPSDSPPRHPRGTNFVHVDSSARSRPPSNVSAGANASTPQDLEKSDGCSRLDLQGVSRPCAEGAGRRSNRSTFSLR